MREMAANDRVLIIDNGASHIKAALIMRNEDGKTSVQELDVPNALARPGKTALTFPPSKLGNSRRPHGMLVGSEIYDAPDFGGMSIRRPHERGFITSWDVQRDVWHALFSEDRGLGLAGKTMRATTRLVLTEPLGVPFHIRSATDSLVFEEFGFAAVSITSPAKLVAHKNDKRNCIVLDTGFSFTHAVPIINGWEYSKACRRLSIGGKALTNHLKNTVSYRSWNMLGEPVVMNAIKERLCYVSMNYMKELCMAQNSRRIQRDYILPDTSRIGMDTLGYVRAGDNIDEEKRENEQVLVMNNERIAIPELLFNPSDAGVNQAGVAELIVQACEAVPEEHRADLYANIIITGGNCHLPNFQSRLEVELRPLVPEIYDINIQMSDEPIRDALKGGIKAIIEDNEEIIRTVTKQQYEKLGSTGIAEEFFCRNIDT